jgi:hypothetical protein
MANNISKRTTRAVIGAMHVNRSLPQTLAFTGTKLLGLGLCHQSPQTGHPTPTATRQEWKNVQDDF